MKSRNLLDVVLMLRHLETQRSKADLIEAINLERAAERNHFSVREKKIGYGLLERQMVNESSLEGFRDALDVLQTGAKVRLLLSSSERDEKQLSYLGAATQEDALRRVISKRTSVKKRQSDRREFVSLIETFTSLSIAEKVDDDLN